MSAVAVGVLCMFVVGAFFAHWIQGSISQPEQSLSESRANWKTKLARSGVAPQVNAPLHPSKGFRFLNFESDGRLLFGYFSKPPGPGPHPAVVVCHGGFALDASDTGTATPFLEAGYAVFVPAWRAENGNPGTFEMYYGEAQDVVAAAEFIASLPDIDPEQVFLFGHSAGGTLALLAAELSTRPRGVSACGPTSSMEALTDVLNASEVPEVPYEWSDRQEHILRSPASFVKDLACPAQMVFGGEDLLLLVQGRQLEEIAKGHAKQVSIKVVEGADHFSALPAAVRHAVEFFHELRKRSRTSQSPPLRYQHGGESVDERFRGHLASWQASAAETVAESLASAGEISNWASVVDGGLPPMDWTGFARNYLDRPLSSKSLRPFPGNGRWITTREFGDVFGLASLDGKRRHILRGKLPNVFERIPDVTFAPAGVALDGSRFAVRWVQRQEGRQTAAWITVHDAIDGRARHLLKDYSDCQFVPEGHLLLWRDAWFEASLPRTANIVSSLDLATGGISPGIVLQGNQTITITPGGKYICSAGSTSGGETQIRVDAVSSANTVAEGRYLDAPLGLNLAISQDGREMATCADGKLTVWDLSNGKLVSQMRIPEPHRHVTWLGERQFLVTDGHLAFDRTSGQLVAALDYRTPPPGTWGGRLQEGSWIWETKDDAVHLRQFPLEALRQRLADDSRATTRPRIRLIVSKAAAAADAEYEGGDELIQRFLDAGAQSVLPVEVVEQPPFDAEVEIKYRWDFGNEGTVKQLTMLGQPLAPDIPRAAVMNDATREIVIDLEVGVYAPRVAGGEELAAPYWKHRAAFRGLPPSVDLAREHTSEAIAFGVAEVVRRIRLPTPDRLRLSPAGALQLTQVESAAQPEKPSVTAADLRTKIVGQTDLDAPLETPILQTAVEGRGERLFAAAFILDQGQLKLLVSKLGPEMLQYDLKGKLTSLKDPHAKGFLWHFTTTADGTKWAGIGSGLLVMGGNNSPTKWIPGAHWPTSATMSADGTKLFVPAELRQPRVTSWDVAQLLMPNPDRPIILVQGKDFVAVWTIPGSRDILCRARTEVWRVDPTNAKVVWQLAPIETSEMWFSTDGSQLIFHEPLRPANAAVYVVDVETGEKTQVGTIVLPISGAGARYFSPDRTHFVTRLDNGRFGVYGTDELIRRQIDPGDLGRPLNENCVAWSPDGRYLAFVMGTPGQRPERYELRVWDLSAPEVSPERVPTNSQN